jgi:hypothetical protein
MWCYRCNCKCCKDGKDGKDGENGKDGKDGKDGENGTCECGNIKMPMCHNGNNIEVALPAVAAHLNHGDTLGLCPTIQPITNESDDKKPTGDTEKE